ncbi:uncharacterized protein LOC110817469 [Carica papaya]|uniref:uncharacterized protein LOC110817469 n=1 Tax=Carica papaya TaxID=3649 RepID=UPI000B8C88A1|nr:uncharacterized protein LOC110817469 [Carica papaya]
MDDSDPPPLGDTATLNQIRRHEEDKAKKLKAIACLFSAVSDRVFLRIMNFESPKAAWEKLKEEFDGGVRSRKVKILRLKNEFALLRMKENESVKDYASKLSDVVNKMRLLWEDFPKSRVVEKILISLPPKFEYKISTLDELADIESISSAELINKLQSSEQRGKKTVRYNFCKRLGHKEKFCRQKQKQEGSQPKQEQQQANVTEVLCEQRDTILVALSQVRLGNGMLETIKGKDNIAIKTREDRKLITDVNFVPILSQNLLSVNKMTNRGYSVGFKDTCYKIYDPEDRLIAFI